MKIPKTAEENFQNLETIKLSQCICNESYKCYNFEDENYNVKDVISNIEFEHSKFNKVYIQKGILEKVSFIDVIFENCDFSNTKFLKCSFIRCQFINCKLCGSSVIDTFINNVSFIDTNAMYFNLSKCDIKNTLFKSSLLRESYFDDIKFKNVYFENVELCYSKFTETSLKDIDISCCKLSGISISLKDIKEAIIDELQVMDLIHLLGVKIKQ